MKYDIVIQDDKSQNSGGWLRNQISGECLRPGRLSKERIRRAGE